MATHKNAKPYSGSRAGGVPFQDKFNPAYMHAGVQNQESAASFAQKDAHRQRIADAINEERSTLDPIQRGAIPVVSRTNSDADLATYAKRLNAYKGRSEDYDITQPSNRQPGASALPRSIAGGAGGASGRTPVDTPDVSPSDVDTESSAYSPPGSAPQSQLDGLPHAGNAGMTAYVGPANGPRDFAGRDVGYQPSAHEALAATIPGYDAMTLEQRGAATMAKYGNRPARGVVTDTGRDSTNFKGETPLQTPGGPAVEYDPRSDLTKSYLAPGDSILPPNATRGVTIDPKYVAPGGSPVGYATNGGGSGSTGRVFDETGDVTRKVDSQMSRLPAEGNTVPPPAPPPRAATPIAGTSESDATRQAESDASAAPLTFPPKSPSDTPPTAAQPVALPPAPAPAPISSPTVPLSTPQSPVAQSSGEGRFGTLSGAIEDWTKANFGALDPKNSNWRSAPPLMTGPPVPPSQLSQLGILGNTTPSYPETPAAGASRVGSVGQTPPDRIPIAQPGDKVTLDDDKEAFPTPPSTSVGPKPIEEDDEESRLQSMNSNVGQSTLSPFEQHYASEDAYA